MDIESQTSESNQIEDFFIDTDLVIGRNNIEDIKCPICHSVFFNPVSCDQCMNHFCKTCQDKNYSRKCPMCNVPSKTRNAVPLLKQLLSQVILKCTYYQDGCSEKLPYEQFEKHIKQCEYQTVRCEIKYERSSCQIMLLKKDINNHRENLCQFRKLDCEYCQKEIAYIDYHRHISECDYRDTKCELCDLQFQVRLKQLHMSVCPNHKKECHHCQKQFQVREWELHEIECQDRSIFCEGCTQNMKLHQLFKHKLECQMYPVICCQCNTKMSRKQYQKHELGECIKNLKIYFGTKIQGLEEELQILKNTRLKFSLHFKDSEIFVNPNQLQAFVKEDVRKRKDRFVLFEQKLENGMIWRFQCNTIKSDWYAVGLVEVTSLYQNKKYTEIGHGAYLLSANGIKYSHHKLEDNSQLTHFRIEKDNIIQLEYLNGTLEFTNITKKLKVSMEIQNMYLHPCACLRTSGDFITII